MTYYKIRTKHGATYYNVSSWKKWHVDEAFLEAIGGVDNKLLILRLEDIQDIQEDELLNHLGGRKKSLSELKK
jgi:hypothetical protein